MEPWDFIDFLVSPGLWAFEAIGVTFCDLHHKPAKMAVTRKGDGAQSLLHPLPSSKLKDNLPALLSELQLFLNIEKEEQEELY